MKTDSRSERTKAVRVAIYARKSNAVGVGDQMYNSIDAQIDMCRSYVKMRERDGWRVVAEYSDMGVSGKSLDRPDFQKLLRAAEDGKIDVILSYKIDRVSRSMYDFLSLLRKLDELGVCLAMSSQNFDTSTVDGRFNANLRMSFAEYERELDSVRIKEKLASTAQRGLYVGGAAPYGYDRVNKCELGQNDKARWVAAIFERFIAGESRTEIAAWLSSSGAPYPINRKNEKIAPERLWAATHVTRILQNPVYMGRVKLKDKTFPGQHVPIVSEELWKQAQDKIEAEKVEWEKAHENTRQLPFPLKGILRCPHCGHRLAPFHSSGRSKRLKRYYVCPNHKSVRLKTKCPYMGLPAEAIEEAMMDQLSELSTDRALTQELQKRLPVLTRTEIVRALAHASAMRTYLRPEQISALMKLVFKVATYDREKELLHVERYL